MQTNEQHDETLTEEQCDATADESFTSTLSSGSQQSNIYEKERSRKRKRSPSSWRQNMRRRNKNAGEAYNTSTGKRVKIKEVKTSKCKCQYKCRDHFSEEERKKIHVNYWGLAEYNRQRDFIQTHTRLKPKGRSTVQSSSRRSLSLMYHLPIDDKIKQVCKDFFLKTLDIGEMVVRYTLLRTDETIHDSRGHKSPGNKTSECLITDVETHIRSFPTLPSHYCRATTRRQYLGSDLSVSKMHRLYLEKCNKEHTQFVSYEIYNKVFNTKFNLSFHVPKKDRCSFCLRYEISDDSEKTAMMPTYNTHIQNKTFIRELKEREKNRASDITTVHAINFDLQKVLITPKGDASDFYYSRKLATYNFSIFDMSTKKAVCNMWNESIGKRGSNEISSLIFKYFTNIDTSQISEIVMFSDSCPGQQKNITFCAMCLYTVVNLPIQKISHYFFERGHSQMEGDSVHARIERSTAHIPIYAPDEWLTAVRMAKITQPTYVVNEIAQKDILNFKDLAAKTIAPKLIDEHGRKIGLQKIRAFQYVKTEPDKMFYKYEITDTDFAHFNISRPRRSAASGSNLASMENFKVPQLYHALLPIPEAKYNDLNKLCQKGLIPTRFHDYYAKLPCSGKTVEYVTDESSSEDDS